VKSQGNGRKKGMKTAQRLLREFEFLFLAEISGKSATSFSLCPSHLIPL
jgi:hypothetical protein